MCHPFQYKHYAVSHCVFAIKGPPWYRRIGWKRWETRVAGELRHMHHMVGMLTHKLNVQTHTDEMLYSAV